MAEHIINVDNEKCIGCNLCIKDCPTINIELVDKKAVIKTQSCIKCAHCVAVCPKAAVSITGFEDDPIEFSKQPLLNPQELIDAFKSRRSIRQFKDTPIPQNIIDQIIEAGRWAPTARNSQNISYIVIKDDKDIIESIAVKLMKRLMPILRLFRVITEEESFGVTDNLFFKGAPVAILVISKDKVSASLASANMALMAETLGLGVLYSGSVSAFVNISSSIRKLLNLKRKDKVVTALVLGYPDVKYHRTALKNPAKVIIR